MKYDSNNEDQDISDDLENFIKDDDITSLHKDVNLGIKPEISEDEHEEPANYSSVFEADNNVKEEIEEQLLHESDEFEIKSFSDFATKNENVIASNKLIHPALDEIKFQISCEIGSISISLEELSKLKVGDCLEFIRWPGKVKLKLNDYLFAEGYLVETEGMLGVKITNNLGALNSLTNSNQDSTG